MDATVPVADCPAAMDAIVVLGTCCAVMETIVVVVAQQPQYKQVWVLDWWQFYSDGRNCAGW